MLCLVLDSEWSEGSISFPMKIFFSEYNFSDIIFYPKVAIRNFIDRKLHKDGTSKDHFFLILIIFQALKKTAEKSRKKTLKY